MSSNRLNEHGVWHKKDAHASNLHHLDESSQVRRHFINNPHHLILTMRPDEKFVVDRENILVELESGLVQNLTESDRARVAEIESRLREEQSTKEADDAISCLPTLSMEDIPLEKHVHKVRKIILDSF